MNFVEVAKFGFLGRSKACFSELLSIDFSYYIFVMQYCRGAVVIDHDCPVPGITWGQDKRHFPKNMQTTAFRAEFEALFTVVFR